MVKTTRIKDGKTSASDVTLANYLDAMLHTATESEEARRDVGEADVENRAITVPHVALDPSELTSVEQTTRAGAGIETPELPRGLSADVQVEHSASVEATPVLTQEEPAAGKPNPDAEVTPESASEPAESDLSLWLDNGRPVWAQKRFDCLVFVIDGLKLAVPLILLGNIQTLDRDLTPLFDQPKWFLGLLPVADGRNLRVVDTARLVMPERYRAESVDQLQFAVGVYDSDWAFGCHQIEGSISLEPDAVKWRSSRTSRPWLAGTVIDRMCALVDLHEFSRTAFQNG